MYDIDEGNKIETFSKQTTLQSNFNLFNILLWPFHFKHALLRKSMRSPLGFGFNSLILWEQNILEFLSKILMD